MSGDRDRQVSRYRQTAGRNLWKETGRKFWCIPWKKHSSNIFEIIE